MPERGPQNLQIRPVRYAPPFEIPWLFAFAPQAIETPQTDYYTFGASFQYWDGFTEATFSAGLGDVPLPEDAPVVWWGWQLPFELDASSRRFAARYFIGPDGVDFVNSGGGFEPGGELSIFAAILQLLPGDDFQVVNGTVVPIDPPYPGIYRLDYEAVLEQRDYSIWVGWLAQLRYRGAQRPSLRMASRILDFWRFEPIGPETELPFEDEIPEEFGQQKVEVLTGSSKLPGPLAPGQRPPVRTFEGKLKQGRVEQVGELPRR